MYRSLRLEINATNRFRAISQIINIVKHMYLGYDNGIFLEYRAIAQMQNTRTIKRLERIFYIDFQPESNRNDSSIAQCQFRRENAVLSHDCRQE